jgi:hypothetical protein
MVLQWADMHRRVNFTMVLQWADTHRRDTLPMVLQWADMYRRDTLQMVLQWADMHRRDTFPMVLQWADMHRSLAHEQYYLLGCRTVDSRHSFGVVYCLHFLGRRIGRQANSNDQNSVRVHGVTSQKIILFIVTAVRISDSTKFIHTADV